MQVVTLTSDLGTRDFYTAALKGCITTHSGITNLIDVTHAIKHFDIKEAAFVIRNAYRYFPKGTIHVVHVSAGEEKVRLLLAVVDGHYFLTFDTGILSLAFERTPQEVFEVNEELLEGASLLNEQAIARVIELLVKEYKPLDFAQPAGNIVSYRSLQPAAQGNTIRGTVIYIDNYGNGITNITQELFTGFVAQRRFGIYTNVASTDTLSKKYSDVEEGEMVCLFNSSGLLEIAVHKGKAENLLGLKTSVSTVLISVE